MLSHTMASESLPPSLPPPPKLVFIIPYRDREQQQQFFDRHMKYILQDYDPDDYRIFYVHQCDARGFNRGALKNIGFLAVKDMWPNDYRAITLVFNDVDTMPYTPNFLQYETTAGRVKHFYGYHFALGGIVAMTAGDFEMVNGFPNFWAWGYEDNLLNYRVLSNRRIQIDRSQFFPIMDKNIMHFNDGLERIINRKEFDRYAQETSEGISSISGLTYQTEPAADDELGTSHFIQVSAFETGTREEVATNQTYNFTQGPRPYGNAAGIRGKRGPVGRKMIFY